tara:strand:+ start:1867 stop:2187 length:321 start_codon:yes stop_codon:yes gene_type:complete
VKIVRAVVRPDNSEAVASSLAKANFPALTRWDTFGRGKQKGVRVGGQTYSDILKTMIFIAVKDDQVAEVIRIIREAAFTGYPGDGKIFVTPLDTVYTIRTGKEELR